MILTLVECAIDAPEVVTLVARYGGHYRKNPQECTKSPQTSSCSPKAMIASLVFVRTVSARDVRGRKCRRTSEKAAPAGEKPFLYECPSLLELMIE